MAESYNVINWNMPCLSPQVERILHSLLIWQTKSIIPLLPFLNFLPLLLSLPPFDTKLCGGNRPLKINSFPFDLFYEYARFIVPCV